jgi:hypothetical protein
MYKFGTAMQACGLSIKVLPLRTRVESRPWWVAFCGDRTLKCGAAHQGNWLVHAAADFIGGMRASSGDLCRCWIRV